MKHIRKDVDQLAREAKAAAAKVVDEARDATASAIDEGRDLARKTFDKIKAARERAASKLD